MVTSNEDAGQGAWRGRATGNQHASAWEVENNVAGEGVNA
jgi:hypothetical protein